jgi:AraC-like DNA-binding protein
MDRQSDVSRPDDAPSFDSLVRRALDLFEQNPQRRWTVDDIAQALGTSRPVLARRFVEALGVPPLRALRQVRMDRARHLLVETDDGLTAISDAVGYDSEFAFSRVFFRHFRIRPGRYRRLHQGEVTSMAIAA